MTQPIPIHFPTKEETDAALEDLFSKMRTHRNWLKTHSEGWQEAITRLGLVASGDTGQSDYVRAFLWSLWRWQPDPDPISGKSWSPVLIRHLDGDLVRDIATVTAWTAGDEWDERHLRLFLTQAIAAAEKPKKAKR